MTVEPDHSAPRVSDQGMRDRRTAPKMQMCVQGKNIAGHERIVPLGQPIRIVQSPRIAEAVRFRQRRIMEFMPSDSEPLFA